MVFAATIIAILGYNWIYKQAFYISTPDGSLYLSIARNFIDTGHFIQTARPYEVDMVVPPGLSIIYTIILGLTYSYHNIVIVQYIIFGITAVLVAKTGAYIYPKAKNISYIVLPMLFFSATIYIEDLNPGMLLTETWVNFFMVLAMFMYFNPKFTQSKKIYLMSIAGFVLFLIRPALSGVLIIALVVMLLFTVRKKLPWKNTVLCLMAFGIILSLNVGINYRETGEFVLIENYSAAGGTYLANNPNAKTEAYYSSSLSEFADELFMDVYFDETLTIHEKNEILGTAAKKFMVENIGFTLKNASVRYENYFIKGWNWNFYIFFLALAVFLRKKTLSKYHVLGIALSFFAVTIVPAFGLYIFRYSLPCLPFFVIINGVFYCYLIHTIWQEFIQKNRRQD